MASALDIVLFSLYAFAGNVGVALTGFGMAIIYLLLWQISVLAGYRNADFKYAVFLQSLALLSAQPLLVRKANVRRNASRRMLLYFVPVTVLSTPLGQYTAGRVGTEIVEMVGGILVTFVACFELYQKRALFWKWTKLWVRRITCGRCCAKEEEKAEEAAEAETETGPEGKQGKQEDEGEQARSVSFVVPSGDNADRSKEETELRTDELFFTEEEEGGEKEDAWEENEKMVTAEKPEGAPADASGGGRGAPARRWNSVIDGNAPFTFTTVFWTLLAGFASGYLGGLCGIRGPPIILFFLHPPRPIKFRDKKAQRATGAAITFVNVSVRVVYYLIDTLAFDRRNYFTAQDWGLYVSTAVFSLLGVLAGGKLFSLLKDSTDAIKGILTILLVLCGVSLLLSSFAGV